MDGRLTHYLLQDCLSSQLARLGWLLGFAMYGSRSKLRIHDSQVVTQRHELAMPSCPDIGIAM